MPAVVYRRFALLLMPCAVVCAATDAEPTQTETSQAAALTAPAATVDAPCRGTDALSQARCKRAQMVSSTCDDVPESARGHCVRCILANNPMSCDTLPTASAAQCHVQEAAIERCADGPIGAAEACLRDAGVALTDHAVTRRQSPQPSFLTSTAAP